MFRVVDKLLLLLLGFPPLYFVFRFLRWYVNTDQVAPAQAEYQSKHNHEQGSKPQNDGGEANGNPEADMST